MIRAALEDSCDRAEPPSRGAARRASASSSSCWRTTRANHRHVDDPRAARHAPRAAHLLRRHRATSATRRRSTSTSSTQVLRIGYNYNGPTEIGGLVLDPELPPQRRSARQVASLRALPLHRAAPRAVPRRGALRAAAAARAGRHARSCGRRSAATSPGMTYQEADRLSQNNKEFIQALFPAEPIYASLLPERRAGASSARSARRRKGVEKMLRRIGFEYAERIDPFDGGPHFVAKTDDISLVRDTRALRGRALRAPATPALRRPSSASFRDHAPWFSACRASCAVRRWRGRAPDAARRRLDVAAGDVVWVQPFEARARDGGGPRLSRRGRDGRGAPRAIEERAIPTTSAIDSAVPSAPPTRGEPARPDVEAAHQDGRRGRPPAPLPRRGPTPRGRRRPRRRSAALPAAPSTSARTQPADEDGRHDAERQVDADGEGEAGHAGQHRRERDRRRRRAPASTAACPASTPSMIVFMSVAWGAGSSGEPNVYALPQEQQRRRHRPARDGGADVLADLLRARAWRPPADPSSGPARCRPPWRRRCAPPRPRSATAARGPRHRSSRSAANTPHDAEQRDQRDARRGLRRRRPRGRRCARRPSRRHAEERRRPARPHQALDRASMAAPAGRADGRDARRRRCRRRRAPPSREDRARRAVGAAAAPRVARRPRDHGQQRPRHRRQRPARRWRCRPWPPRPRRCSARSATRWSPALIVARGASSRAHSGAVSPAPTSAMSGITTSAEMTLPEHHDRRLPIAQDVADRRGAPAPSRAPAPRWAAPARPRTLGGREHERSPAPASRPRPAQPRKIQRRRASRAARSRAAPPRTRCPRGTGSSSRAAHDEQIAQRNHGRDAQHAAEERQRGDLPVAAGRGPTGRARGG